MEKTVLLMNRSSVHWSDEGRSLEEGDGGTSVGIDGTTELREEEGGEGRMEGGEGREGGG